MNNVFTAKLLQSLRNKKGEKGFTLIELLVVVIIIGVLAAVALPNLLAQVGKARESEGKTGVGTITRAQQTRHFETGLFEDVTDANFATLAGNNLSITVDSEYFNFASDAGAPADATDPALVVTTALAPATTTPTRTAQQTAEANGTRAFGSRMDFAAGNYDSILCQTNVVSATAPAITAPTAGTGGAPGTPAVCGTGATQIR